MFIRIFLTIFAILFSFGATAQTSIIGSNSIRYELKKDSEVVFLKEGTSITISSGECVSEKLSILYKIESCTSAKLVTVSKGIVTESGGGKTFVKSIRLEVIAPLVGFASMLVAMAFLKSFAVATLTFVVFAAAFAATTTFATLTFVVFAAAFAALAAAFAALATAFAALCAVTENYKWEKSAKNFFFFAGVYELLMILILSIVV